MALARALLSRAFLRKRRGSASGLWPRLGLIVWGALALVPAPLQFVHPVAAVHNACFGVWLLGISRVNGPCSVACLHYQRPPKVYTNGIVDEDKDPVLGAPLLSDQAKTGLRFFLIYFE